MRSKTLPAYLPLYMRPAPTGPRSTLDRLRSHDRLASIARLRAAVTALGQVDVTGWDDTTLTEHLDELSDSLCAIDAQLSRVADAIRARGFRIEESLAARPGARAWLTGPNLSEAAARMGQCGSSTWRRRPPP